MTMKGTLQACALGAIILAGCNRLPPRPKSIREVHTELRQHYDLFAPDALAKRVERIRPHVEAVLGAPLAGPVPVVRISREMHASWLAEEAVRRSRGLNRTERNRLRMVARIHAWKETGYLGMVRRPDEGVVLLPDNFLSCPRQGRAADLDVVIAHELAHLFQARRFGLKRWHDDESVGEEKEARHAAAEGHAEYVARRVAARMNISDAFDRLAAELETSLDRLSPMELATTMQVRAQRSFRYAWGERFFTAIADRLGHAGALERVFSDPPRSQWHVLHPARYLAGERADRGLDLAPIVAEHGTGDEEPEALLAPLVRLQAGDAADGALRSAMVLLSLGPGALQGRRAWVYVTRCESDRAARRFFDAVRRAAREEGDHAIYPGQVLQVIRAEYSDLPGGGFSASRRLRAHPLLLMPPVDSQAVALHRGEYVVQLVAPILGEETGLLVRLAGRMLDTLLGSASGRGPDADASTRVRALLARAKKGWVKTATQEQLVRLLDDPDGELRATAVAIVAGHDSETIGQFLKQAATHSDPGVRARAVSLLGRNQDMVKPLGDPDPQVRLAALGTLAARSWFERAPPAMIDALLQDSDPGVRAATLEALDEVEDFPRNRIAPLTRDPDEGVRGLAWAMAGKELADQALSRGLGDPSPFVRAKVCWYLILGGRAADNDLVLAGLGAALDDPDASVRMSVMFPLATMDNIEPLAPKLIAVLARGDMRPIAISLLAGLTSPKAKAALAPYILDPDQRKSVVEALADYGKAKPLLREALRDWDPQVRLAAAVGLREQGDEAVDVAGLALEVLRSSNPGNAAVVLGNLAEADGLGKHRAGARTALLAALDAEDGKTRSDVLEALMKLRPVQEQTIRAVLALLRDEDLYVRWAVTRAISELGERAASAVPLLIELLVQKRDDDDDLTEYIDALVDIGAKAKPALPALRKLLDHKQSDVREAAQDAIGQIEMAGKR